MTIERTLTAAHANAARVVGRLSIMLSSRRGLTREAVHGLARTLRETADALERML